MVFHTRAPSRRSPLSSSQRWALCSLARFVALSFARTASSLLSPWVFSSFDMVLDKGSLDVLVGEVTGSSLPAISYLSEVKRVLRPGGKYACVTGAQSNGLGLLLETFRQGWLLNVHRILLVSNSSDPQLQPYLVYAIKSSTEDLAPVKCFFGSSPNPCAETQMQILEDTIKKENELRTRRIH